MRQMLVALQEHVFRVVYERPDEHVTINNNTGTILCLICTEIALPQDRE